MEEQAAAHPVWSSDNEGIKDEFRRLEKDRDEWLRRFSRADSEAERYQHALENIVFQHSRGKSAADLAVLAFDAVKAR